MADTIKTTLRIDAMDCPTEANLLQKGLAALPGVVGLDFDLLRRRLVVTHERRDIAPVLSAIEKLGMHAEVLADAGASSDKPSRQSGPPPSRTGMVWHLGLTGVLASVAEVLALSLGNEHSPWVMACAATAILLGGRDTARKGWAALRAGAININLLMTAAVAGALAIGEWPEAAMVVWLFGVAEALEQLSLDRARRAIQSVMTLVPDLATVRQAGGEWTTVPLAEVLMGAILRIRPGERIPLDGRVIDGESSVNQAPVTGESLPVAKRAGDTVYAGSLNERGVLEVEVTAVKGATTVDRIAELVQSGYAQRAPTQRFVDRFAHIYTPVVMLVAIGIALGMPVLLNESWRDALYSALVLLVIACPCALVISTPVTIVSGLAAAAKHGIVVKGGLYLELGRSLKSLALDKTGTLTRGKPALTDVVPLGSVMTREDALQVAASLEAIATHPIAQAVVDANAREPLQVSNFETLTGRGVKGVIEGVEWHLGNHRLAEDLGVCNAALEKMLEGLEVKGKTAMVLASRGAAMAVLAVADTVRDTSREAVAALVKLGVAPVMLTGDNSRTAQAVGKAVSITEVFGDLMPEEKLGAVAALAKDGLVGMVGDGINDAPALARADIGFAMGAAGSDTAIETADVALMTDDLRKIAKFLSLSRKAHIVLWQNIAFALATKFVFLAATLMGHGSLWLAVFADLGASLVVVANGLRLLRA